jgi:hypothetical protein
MMYAFTRAEKMWAFGVSAGVFILLMLLAILWVYYTLTRPPKRWKKPRKTYWTWER